ncbi:MAG: topoisomerase C-terminal repeat-containing protein [Alphaproteobacteria bacterium]
MLDALDEALGPHFFPQTDPNVDPRLCPACKQGRLALKLGKFGAFVGCSTYPECTYTRQLAEGLKENGGGAVLEGPVELGKDPATGETVSLRKGPYGLYLQLGEAKEKGDKPKRVSLPPDRSPDNIELDYALQLLRLPREVGKHPADDAPILAGIGRYGPYVQHGKNYRSLPTVDDALTIGLNRAVDLLAQPAKRGRTASALRTLGEHPEDGKPITVHEGRYGPYVKHGSTNATIPKSSSPEAITLEEALPLLAAREERKKKKKASKPRPKTAKKKSAKKKKKAPTKPAADTPASST